MTEQEIREQCAARALGVCQTMSHAYRAQNEPLTADGISNAGVYAVSAIFGIGIEEAIVWCRSKSKD